MPLLVMAEMAWVLRGAKWPRERVLKTLEGLLRTRGVTPEAPDLVRRAIDSTGQGGAFLDHLIAEVGFANGCLGAITFDALFGKTPKVRKLD